MAPQQPSVATIVSDPQHVEPSSFDLITALQQRWVVSLKESKIKFVIYPNYSDTKYKKSESKPLQLYINPSDR